MNDLRRETVPPYEKPGAMDKCATCDGARYLHYVHDGEVTCYCKGDGGWPGPQQASCECKGFVEPLLPS